MPRPAPPGRAPALLTALFFFSGLAGLVYQVVWMRQLQLLLGASTLASSAVLAAFMGGFALGAWAVGSLGDRARRPLRLYGLVEVGIGVAALGVPPLLTWLEPTYASAAGQAPAWALAPLRFGVAVLALLLPTMLMGASLPLMVAEATRRGGPVARSLGVLYASNLAGAIAGALLAGFFLIRALGLSGANASAAFTNLLIGAVAALASKPLPAASGASAAHDAERVPALEPWLPALLFLSGFVVLAFEVVWTRLLVFSLGSTVYGFAVVLSSTLLGLALGAKLAPRVVSAAGRPGVRLASTYAGVSVAAALGLFVAPWLFEITVALSGWLGTGGGSFLVASYLCAALVLLVPATLAGVAFPGLAALAGAASQETSLGVGRAQAVNGVGAILGAVSAGLLLVPTLGLSGSVAFLVGIEGLAGLGICVAVRAPKGGSLGVGLATLLSVSVVLLASPDRGNALDGVLRAERGGESPPLVEYREGAVSTCAVVQDDRGRALRLDGFEAAAIGGTYGYMRCMALVPAVLHPAPRRALVICFGTGTTAGTLTLDPGLERLDIVELEPVVLELAHHFVDKNHAVLEDPRVRTHVEDGRAYVVGAPPASYDLVTLEPMPPTHSGVVTLYSLEFYRYVARALKPDGLACQWVPTQFLREEDTRSIVASFSQAFRSAALFQVGTTGILVGSNSPRPLLDLARVRRRLAEAPRLQAELERCGYPSPASFLTGFALDEVGVADLARGAALITDDDPRIEHAPIRHRVVPYVGEFTPWQAESLAAICALAVRPSSLRSLPAVDDARRLRFAHLQSRADRSLGAPDRAVRRFLQLAPNLGDVTSRAGAHLAAGQLLLDFGRADLAAKEVDRAESIDPDHPGVPHARAALARARR